MKEQYSNKNINYIGNVINAMEQPSKANITAQKNKSNKLLFIGNKAYKEGAECLIKSFASLKAHYYDLTLDIIGMQESDFTELPQGVCCHGYLNKGNENDLNIFYELMRESKIFINTTPKWGAFSATLEAMYFYTPIIISPYKEFIETFGPHIDFGYFCELNQTVLLTENIKIILDLPYEKFDKLCVNAHSAVADYSWANYIDKFLEKTESLIIEKEMHR
ncbi:hypothetical protein AwDysgo_04650 [Bacteroidales bacterium]|nr:hypothetical protein AwDysgo_04650 [Bacteroidales bacterium]